MTDGGTFPPPIGNGPGARSFPVTAATGFFFAISAGGAFLPAMGALLLSGSESSSSLDEIELFESFCCLSASGLSLVTSGLLPVLIVAPPTSELRRLTILSFVFDCVTFPLVAPASAELLLFVGRGDGSLELEESLSLLELPESEPPELPESDPLELESEELPLLDSVLVDFFR